MRFNKAVLRSLAMVSQLGFCVLAPVLFCVFIGYQIDSRYGTMWTIPLLILGVLAGVRCAWQMLRSVMAQERRDAQKQRQQREDRMTREGISKPKQPSRIFTGKDKGGV